ncbi:uncharacterized protein LOC131209085 [Anopheles bellator]|uniref:uncharacterized protein LOC131209085 n=1 Tax=Anopheles bellator TaxID=139047 RepID=UPI002649C9C5|nr:uncharacterized protein LOC131209085 [Anopheles bellator]
MRCPFELVLLLAIVVPSARLAPQRSIDFLLGDEELQAVVKPIASQPEVPPITEQFDGDRQEKELAVVQATVDPIENEQQTEDSASDVTDEALDEESVTDEPQREEPSEQPAVDAKDIAPTSTPVVTTSSPAAATTVLDSSTTPSDSEENRDSAEEQLTTNPIVVQDTEEQNSTESSEDSNQLAQDVNTFIQDLANEVRAGKEGQQPQHTNGPEYLTERSEETTSLQPKAGVPLYPTIAPNVPDRQGDGPKSLESSEEANEQEQLKVDPNNDQQRSSGPSLTEDQFRSLIEKLRWYDQPRFAEFDQWQHHQFPQRSSWQQQQQRDERQQHYQSHGSESFHGHGFHRTAWH